MSANARCHRSKMFVSESFKVFGGLPPVFESDFKFSECELLALDRCFEPPEDSTALIEQDEFTQLSSSSFNESSSERVNALPHLEFEFEPELWTGLFSS